MAKVKLTKTELKRQKESLKRFERYLPMLQLKKQQLQREVDKAHQRRQQLENKLDEVVETMNAWGALLGEDVELEKLVTLKQVEQSKDHIAGVEVPVFVHAGIRVQSYDLFALPLWVDRAIEALREIISLTTQVTIAEEQERRLSVELRVTSQRVNLFEEVKIPETRNNIRRISIYLGDQQTAAFGWALIAKRKLQAAPS